MQERDSPTLGLVICTVAKVSIFRFRFPRNIQRVSIPTNHNVRFYYVTPGDLLAFFPIH